MSIAANREKNPDIRRILEVLSQQLLKLLPAQIRRICYSCGRIDDVLRRMLVWWYLTSTAVQRYL